MSWETARWLLTITSEVGGVLALVGIALSGIRRATLALKKQKADFDCYLNTLEDWTGNTIERTDLGLYVLNMTSGLTSLRDQNHFNALVSLMLFLVCMGFEFVGVFASPSAGRDPVLRAFEGGFMFMCLGHLVSAWRADRRATQVRRRFDEMWVEVLNKHRSRQKKTD